jgi:hypothetical protein
MPRLAVVTLLTRAALAPLAAMALAPSPMAPATEPERPVPFKIGETLTYDVSWSSFFTAGTAVTAVKDKHPSFGSTAYYIVAEGRSGPLLSALYPTYYKVDTLLDSVTLLAQRGSTYSEEGHRHRYRTTRFDRPARKVFFESQTDTSVASELAAPPSSQDVLSAVYAMRAMTFTAGTRVTMPVSDNGKNYSVRFEIGAPEFVPLSTGAVRAWRIAAMVLDDHEEAFGRNLAIWMSDDARHLPVRLQAALPVGDFDLTLRSAR